MSSSPAERALAAIASAYAAALTELGEDRLEGVAKHLDAADAQLASVTAPQRDAEAASDWRQKAREAHQALLAALSVERDATAAALRRGRRAQRVLAAYGGRIDWTGSRLEGSA